MIVFGNKKLLLKRIGLFLFLGKDKSADIVFGFGVTNSQQDTNVARSIAMETVRKLPLSYQVNFGSVRMENRPVTLFELTPTRKQAEIIETLRSSILTSRQNFDLKTSLDYITENVLKLGTGYRFDVPKTLVLFLNKAPSDLVTGSKAIATLLDNGNIKIVVVGVGVEITEADLLVLVNGDKDMVRMVKEKTLDSDEILDVNTITAKSLKIYLCY